MPPNARHTVSGAAHSGRNVSEANSVILRGYEQHINQDVADIAVGKATWDENTTLDAVTAALAQCLHVRAEEVDVADEDTDQNLRNWDALVTCEKETVRGDVSTSLDIYVQETVQPQPSESDLASAFARAAGTAVLFPAAEMPPSAYWLATEDGLVTRARVYDSDDEEPRFTIDRIEAPVSRLPHVTVARIPEIVRELKIATPLADAFAAHLHRMHPQETSTPAGGQRAPWAPGRNSSVRWKPSGRPPAGIRLISTASVSKRATSWTRYAINCPRTSPRCSRVP